MDPFERHAEEKPDCEFVLRGHPMKSAPRPLRGVTEIGQKVLAIPQEEEGKKPQELPENQPIGEQFIIRE